MGAALSAYEDKVLRLVAEPGRVLERGRDGRSTHELPNRMS